MINIPKKITKKFGRDGTIIKHYELQKIYPHIILYKCIETGLIESFSKNDFHSETEETLVENEIQRNKLLDFLKHNEFITSYEAYKRFKINKIAKRVSELKKEGYVFKEEWCDHIAQSGINRKFKKYYLLEGKNNEI